jgi:hypothetical protein
VSDRDPAVPTQAPQPDGTPAVASARPPHMQYRANARRCPPGTHLVVAIVGIAAVIASWRWAASPWLTGLLIVGFVLLERGFVVLKPNEAVVLTLFGRYTGTIDTPGLWLIDPFAAPPFSAREQVSLRINNFQTEKIKVNDLSGNPIDIAAVIVWQVVDTAKSVFDVQDFQQFVTVQSEAALRHLANLYPYDDYREDGKSLRNGTEEIHTVLQTELQSRLQAAGITVLETRLTHLAYAPEIAETMLRRQQAEAILAARTTMVRGAVGLVHMALTQLERSDLVDLDTERKAAMVSNLMVVLSGDQSPMPVINTGTLYS